MDNVVYVDTILTIEDLTVWYEGSFNKRSVIIENLRLNIKEREVFGLLGPNGAGKTTLIKSIVGLITTKSGRIDISGETRSIGYMPEIAYYHWFLTPRELLTSLGYLTGMNASDIRSRLPLIAKLVGLEDHIDTLIKDLSKGLKGRLNLAQAILHDPKLLILDEPFSGLDPIGRIEVREILKRLKSGGKTIFLSSHELSEAELMCDTIGIMRKGCLARNGALGELLAEAGEHNLEKYFMKIIEGGR